MSVWAIGISTAVAAGGAAYSSSQARVAGNKANDTNTRLTQETNALNKQQFDESRGSTGSAILPVYLSAYEQGLGNDAAKAAQAFFRYGGGVDKQLDAGQRMLARYRPAIDAGDQTVIDLATGKIGTDRMNALQPVLAARTGLAKSRASSINESLDQILSGLRTSRTAAGFRGGSTFDNNRVLDATTSARMGAATELGQANLDNANQVNGLTESNLQLILNSLNQPYERAQQNLAFNQLPATSLADYYSKAMSPLSFFRINPGNAPQAQIPQVGAVPTNGQGIGAGISSAASGIGNYLAQQQLMQQLGRFYGSGVGSGGAPTMPAGAVNTTGGLI